MITLITLIALITLITPLKVLTTTHTELKTNHKSKINDHVNTTEKLNKLHGDYQDISKKHESLQGLFEEKERNLVKEREEREQLIQIHTQLQNTHNQVALITLITLLITLLTIL